MGTYLVNLFSSFFVQICEELMMRCLAPDCQNSGLGCDNMTVVLVCFTNGQGYDALRERCGMASRCGPAADVFTNAGGGQATLTRDAGLSRRPVQSSNITE